MGRAPCCSKVGLHRGPWSAREDALLSSYIHTHGEGNWRSLPKKAGLLRCGKSCRLRWMNYLRPDIKRGNIGPEEEDLIVRLHGLLGNRWSLIAGRLPGRTDNEIKNYWNSHLSKKLKKQGFVLKEVPRRSKRSPKATYTHKTQTHSRKSVGRTMDEGSDTGLEAAAAAAPAETRVYAPKPTRFAPRVAAESSEGGSDQRAAESWSSGSDDVGFSWCDAGELEEAAAGFLDANQLDMGFDQFQFQDATSLESLYHEYSMLLQSEMDTNQLAEPLMV